MSSRDSHQTFNCHAAAPVFSGIFLASRNVCDGISFHKAATRGLLCVCLSISLRFWTLKKQNLGEKNTWCVGWKATRRIINALQREDALAAYRETAESCIHCFSVTHIWHQDVVVLPLSLHPQTEQFSWKPQPAWPAAVQGGLYKILRAVFLWNAGGGVRSEENSSHVLGDTWIISMCARGAVKIIWTKKHFWSVRCVTMTLSVTLAALSVRLAAFQEKN